MLDKAKETKKPILFITSDAKEDWWLLLNKNEKISPRYELIKEMHSYADVGFHIYEMDHFIERAGDYLNMTFDRSKIQRAVTEMKELEEPVVGKDHKLELTSGMPFADVVEVSYYPEIPSVDQATVGGARIVKLEEDSDSTGANTGINFSKAGKKKGMKNKK